jgi:formamidopyrimidine-DNA glycosylase
MPEFVEAEAYRRTIEPVVGERLDRIELRDERLLRHGDVSASAIGGMLGGATIAAARRIGKVVLIDVDTGHTIALAFGLRGWLSLDGAVARPNGDGWRRRSPHADHVRLVMTVSDRRLELEDQLRLATLRIDVDESAFGVDVLDLDAAGLREMCARSSQPVKTLLMDQRRIAGIGNLIADEMLYQGRIDPRRRADDLDADDLHHLWEGIRRTRTRVAERNGSHQGVMIQSGSRERGAACPRCDVPIERVSVGGRTTYFCPDHQR